MLDKPFQQALPILNQLHNAGYEAYFVGGCVRDILLNKTIKDIDITTSAKPEVVQSLFEKVIPVGIEHGTVIVRHNKISYEVTTFRTDRTYSDDSLLVRSIEEDLKRRDFTMNALAMDVNGKIIDLFDGIKDIKNKIIRAVGNSKERFNEDPLRIIRAFRFRSQLGFSIEDNTLSTMISLKYKIKELAQERLLNEFEKIIQSPFAMESLQLMQEYDFFNILPGFLNIKKPMKLIFQKFKPLKRFSSFIALVCYLDTTNNINQWINDWKGSNQMKQEAYNLYRCLERYAQTKLDHWLVYILHKELVDDFIQVVQMIFNEKIYRDTFKQLENELQIRKRNELMLNGHNLMELYPDRNPGPWLQVSLDMLEYEVVQNKLKNEYHTLKEWIECNPPEIN